MGDVSTAVGCAVGIPIGVAVLVLFLFWVRLQRRFQKERADDEELERQIYDETGSIDFTNGIANIHAMEGHREDTNNASDKTEPYVNTDDSFNMIDSSTNTSDVEKSNNNNNNSNNNNAKSNSSTTRATVSRNNSGNVYVPAYRKRINALQMHGFHSSSAVSSLHNATNNNSEASLPGVSGVSQQGSISSSQLPQAAMIRPPPVALSVYDKMVPIMDDTTESPVMNRSSSGFFSRDVKRNASRRELQSIHSETNLLQSYYRDENIDLGSYYPRHSSTNLREVGATLASVTRGPPLNFTSTNATINSPTLVESTITGKRHSNLSCLTRTPSSPSSAAHGITEYKSEHGPQDVFATPTSTKTLDIGLGLVTAKDHRQSISPVKYHANATATTAATATTNTDTNTADHTTNMGSPRQTEGKDIYRLQNNYDPENITQIEEEDQYENEFTNYRENKRTFIDSMKPVA